MSDNIAELVARLEHAATTAANDDLSEPMTDKRARHVERITVILEAAQALTRIAGERDALLSGATAVLPHTRKHAEDLYTVAVACLKTYGVDVESRAQERDRLRAALRDMHRRAQRAEGRSSAAQFIVNLWRGTLQRRPNEYLIRVILDEIDRALNRRRAREALRGEKP